MARLSLAFYRAKGLSRPLMCIDLSHLLPQYINKTQNKIITANSIRSYTFTKKRRHGQVTDEPSEGCSAPCEREYNMQ